MARITNTGLALILGSALLLSACSATPPAAKSTPAGDATRSVDAAMFNPVDTADFPTLLKDPPKDPDMIMLFVDPARAPGPTQTVSGRVGDIESYALEPGALILDVRTGTGQVVRVVMNKHSRVLLPGATEATAATGSYGEIDEGRSPVLPGMRFDGTVKTLRISELSGRPTHYVVSARLAPE